MTTNTIESFFAILKRAAHGTFHSVSEKHLHPYLGEREFKCNTRKLDGGARTATAISRIEAKRLQYNTHIGKE